MAKKHYFVNDLANDYTVTPGSKDTICIHGDGNSAYCFLNVDISEYPNVHQYLNIPTKVGNDLVVKTIFINDSYAVIKTVTTTIQNYYTDLTLQELDYYSFGVHNQINQSTYLGLGGLYAEGMPHTSGSDFILASGGKNEELTLYSGGSDYVYDAKGNDTYTFAKEYYSSSYASWDSNGYTGWDTIMENKGNDVYLVDTNGAMANIYDAAGKDYYHARGTYSYLYIEDSKGNDAYETEDYGILRVYDYKGNDIYRFSSNYDSEVRDYVGNDKYYIDNTAPEDDSYDIYDYAGKDYYEITDAMGVYISDDAGKDKYVVKDCTGLDDSTYQTSLYIYDGAGNDVYQFDNVRFNGYGSDANIYDDAGNDKYSLNDVSYLWITDYEGKDNYNITGNSYETCIYDYDGKDTYNVKGTYDNWMYYAYIYDSGYTNDKYNFAYVYNDDNTLVYDDGGNDKYTLESCSDVDIYDYLGDDKYNIKGSYTDDVYIYDEDGKDTYNVKGSYDKKTKTINWAYDVEIDDYGDYEDKYNLQYVDDADISDYGTTKDTYNIKSSTGYINDKGGDDVYKLSNLVANHEIWITDEGGNDKLNISGTNKNNIVLLADIKADGSIYEGSLILYDKKSGGIVYLNEFYSDSDNNGNLDSLGSGYIESIKVGGKTINADLDYNLFNYVKSEVASWLSTNGYSYVEDVFLGDNQADKDALIQIFVNAQNAM